MGRPMSQNLARRGFAVRAWNRTGRPYDPGTRAPDGDYVLMPSAAAAVAEASITVTMLSDLAAARAVCDGPDGALAAAAAGSIVVVMGTVSPRAVAEWASELSIRGLRMVDAPVSGGDVGAREATLSIMVGGADADVAAVRPVLEAMGSSVRHFGPIGSGQLAKACNQIVVGLTLTALAEAVTLGARGGLDIDLLLDALAGGLAGSRALEVKRALLTSRDFTPGGMADSQLKDLGFALEAGRALGVALPTTAIVDQLYGALSARGHGAEDHSAIVRIIEELSGAGPDEQGRTPTRTT